MKNRKKKESRVFDVIVLLFFGLFTAGITSVLFYVYPVSVLTCEYVEPNQVNCRLQERVIGLIPIQETAIVDLKGAYVTKKVIEVRRDGGKEKLITDRVVLQTDLDKLPLNSFDETGGFLARNTLIRLRNFSAPPPRNPCESGRRPGYPWGSASFSSPCP